MSDGPEAGAVAGLAKVSRTAYYRNFESMDDVLRWFCDSVMSECLDGMPSDA